MKTRNKTSDFYFLGQAPLSKSLLNRALIVKSWFPEFSIQGTSLCEDILIMKKAIKNLSQKKEFYCGMSGTAFRFLSVRLSREKGDFLLTAHPSLWKRPLEETAPLLSQLSVHTKKTDKGFLISSEGWKIQGDGVYVPSRLSSQYGSALLLNSWNLKQDLYFSLSPKAVSYSYFKMTLDFVQKLGLLVQKKDREFFIPKEQKLKKGSYAPEQDKSCLFALACFAVFKGQAVFLNWEENSLQPDNIFPEILKEMGVPIKKENNKLTVFKGSNLKPLNISLKSSPDLFPLLCVLCAKAEGLSQITGISHLAFKESNRLNKIEELLAFCKIQVKREKDMFLIYGKKNWGQIPPFVFLAEKDHRLVMAGELVAALGAPIKIIGKEFVNKSFPEFYSLIHSF